MLRMVQMEIGGSDLLRCYPWLDLVKLIQQRGDLPCLRANVDLIETKAEEDVAREIPAWLVI